MFILFSYLLLLILSSAVHSYFKGVIYATSRAISHGFHPENEEWANMGQGAPETGPLEGAPARNFTMSIPDAELEYAPVAGLHDLRVKVADYYNHLYRQGMDSQYTSENICVVPGGRAGITRIMAALATTQVGYFIPDYTAYEQALGLFLRVSPCPLLHRDVNEAMMPPEEFDFQINGAGIGAMLMSNPANPTGQSIEGEHLKGYVKVARQSGSAIIMDEFYSHYYYDGEAVDPQDGGADDDTNWPKTVSSASYIKDVNVDPILIINGLTKNWRCPGFRICWIVAPKKIVNLLASAGSYLDGGGKFMLRTIIQSSAPDIFFSSSLTQPAIAQYSQCSVATFVAALDGVGFYSTRHMGLATSLSQEAGLFAYRVGQTRYHCPVEADGNLLHLG